MRDKWYGDKADVVKWGVLLKLAERYGAKHILQVLYYRKTRWPKIQLDGQPVELPEAVVWHFREAKRIVEIDAGKGVKVKVWPEDFEDREEYHQQVAKWLRNGKRKRTPRIVLLDPDTGLQPRRATLSHVRNDEIRRVWEELKNGDVLAVFQHRPGRNGRPWIEAKRKQFQRAIGPHGGVKVGRVEDIAPNAALFYAQKGSPTGS
jgi:hypothetical protein